VIKKFLPIILQAILKLLADKEFKKLVWEITQIEYRWLRGELDTDDAFVEIVDEVENYLTAKY
jgi:hypothetical protein